MVGDGGWAGSARLISAALKRPRRGCLNVSLCSLFLRFRLHKSAAVVTQTHLQSCGEDFFQTHTCFRFPKQK